MTYPLTWVTVATKNTPWKIDPLKLAHLQATAWIISGIILLIILIIIYVYYKKAQESKENASEESEEV